MDKASNVIRRSGVMLKSMGSGHQELNMVISQLQDVRSTAKAFATAQNTASQDMLKWSSSEENLAIRDTFVHLAELNALWTEVQKDFTDNLKAFVSQFSMILEAEHHLDQARAHVTACEMKATKIKKESRKAARRGNGAEVQQLEIKLVQAENSFVQAQNEVLGQVQENEAVKLIRIKEGLLKLSDSYLELATKCCIIHEAHRDIARLIPDVYGNELCEIRYTGQEPAKEVVLRAKEGVRAYSRHAPSIVPCAPIPEGPPPPYTPTNHIDNSPYNPHYTGHSSSPQVCGVGSASENSNPFRFSPQSFGSNRSPEARDRGSTRDLSDSNAPNRNPFRQDANNRR